MNLIYCVLPWASHNSVISSDDVKLMMRLMKPEKKFEVYNWRFSIKRVKENYVNEGVKDLICNYPDTGHPPLKTILHSIII